MLQFNRIFMTGMLPLLMTQILANESVEISYYEDGAIREEIHCMEIEGKVVRHGNIRGYFPSGALSLIGIYQNDLEEGLFFQYYENGAKGAEANFIHGKRFGEATMYFPSGLKKQSVQWKDGVKTGPYKEYAENGQLILDFTYVNDQPDGPFKRYNDAGFLIEEATYKEGKLHGSYRAIDQEGREVHLQYTDDVKNGPFVVYQRDRGDGVLIPLVEGAFKDSKLHGKLKEYNHLGNIVVLTNYKEDKKEGVAFVYNEFGELANTIEFVNDLKDGLEITYLPSGVITKKVQYKQGLLEKELKLN